MSAYRLGMKRFGSTVWKFAQRLWQGKPISGCGKKYQVSCNKSPWLTAETTPLSEISVAELRLGNKAAVYGGMKMAEKMHLEGKHRWTENSGVVLLTTKTASTASAQLARILGTDSLQIHYAQSCRVLLRQITSTSQLSSSPHCLAIRLSVWFESFFLFFLF